MLYISPQVSCQQNTSNLPLNNNTFNYNLTLIVYYSSLEIEVDHAVIT